MIITTNAYNERRYGKPWLARITFEGAKADFNFIDWCGDPGEKGEFEFNAYENEVFAMGQKDYRKNRKNFDYYTHKKGELVKIGKVAAKKLYATNNER